jgi:transposase
LLGILEDIDGREYIVMMGHLGSGQDKLFYSFNLDNHIPREHLLRGIDYFLDLRDLRQHLAPFYSPMGRPSIDPELMIRMLMRGLLFRHPVRAQAVRGGTS